MLDDEFKKLIQYSPHEIYIIDAVSFKYLYVNDGALSSIGYSYDELSSMSVYDINPYLTQEKIIELQNEENKEGKVLNRTIHRRKDGSEYHVQSLIHTIRYQNTDAYVVFDTDISEQVKTEKLLIKQTQLLNHQANHDTLTNLPNRMLFKDRLTQIIKSSTRHKEQFALLFIDLDQFKKINDSLGHHIGDEVLIESASRLGSIIRDEDTLARLGGR